MWLESGKTDIAIVYIDALFDDLEKLWRTKKSEKEIILSNFQCKRKQNLNITGKVLTAILLFKYHCPA